MSSTLDVLRGAQQPRIMVVPASAPGLLAEKGLELVNGIAGMGLDPWQDMGLSHSLAQNPDGALAALQVGVAMARQNGKDELLAARGLCALCLDELNEEFSLHTAHEAKTAVRAFVRLKSIIEATPELRRRVRSYSHARGDEAINMRNGKSMMFGTRTSGGFRGFTGALLFLNEAMIIADQFYGTLLPTLSAKSMEGSPQVWFAGSPVDAQVHEHGQVFSNIRRMALDGDAASLAYFEWSLDVDSPDDVTPEMASDRLLWAATNPALGRRISPNYIRDMEFLTLPARQFAVERLGVWCMPVMDGYGAVIDTRDWEQLTDRASAAGEVWFAFDVQPDRGTSTIAAAGHRPDGLNHVEVIEHRPGTEWLPARVAELVKGHRNAGVRYDGAGPAASLIPDLEDLGVECEPFTSREHAQACGLLYDQVKQQRLRHLGQPMLRDAIRGAKKRPLGDAWAWDRKSSAVDISPLVAVTLALWGAATAPAWKEPMVSWA